MATCGYICPACNGMGFLPNLTNCDWCNPLNKKKMVEIFHNNRCGKSRDALKLLSENFESIKVTNYLENAPGIDILKNIIETLKIKPIELIRQKETLFINNFKGKNFTDEEWITIMHQNPILIERPIIIIGNKVIIGREKEKVLNFIKE